MKIWMIYFDKWFHDHLYNRSSWHVFKGFKLKLVTYGENEFQYLISSCFFNIIVFNSANFKSIFLFDLQTTSDKSFLKHIWNSDQAASKVGNREKFLCIRVWSFLMRQAKGAKYLYKSKEEKSGWNLFSLRMRNCSWIFGW